MQNWLLDEFKLSDKLKFPEMKIVPQLGIQPGSFSSNATMLTSRPPKLFITNYFASCYDYLHGGICTPYFE